MTNSSNEWFLEKDIHKYENDPEFVAEGLALKVTEEMLQCLEQKKLNQSWLAEKMGVSRAHVSRILNARPNMTLLTIAKIAIALGVKPDVCLDNEPWRLELFQTRSTSDYTSTNTLAASSDLFGSLSAEENVGAAI